MIFLLACLLITAKAIPLCKESGVNVPCTVSSYVPTAVSKIVSSISNRIESEGSENGAFVPSTEIPVTSKTGPDVSTKPFSTTHVFTDTSPVTKVAAKSSLVTKNAANSSLVTKVVANSSLVTKVAANSSLVTKVAAKISIARNDEVNVPLVNTSAIHIGFLNRLNVQHPIPIKRNFKIPHFFTNWPHQNMGDIYMKSKPMGDFRKHKKTDKFRNTDIATKTPTESHWTLPWYPDTFTWYDFPSIAPKYLGNTENMVYERLGQGKFPEILSLNSIVEQGAFFADKSEWMDKVSAKIREAFRKCQMMSKRLRQNVELCNDMKDYEEDENINDDEWLVLNSIPVKEMFLKRQTVLPINFGLMFHGETEEATTKPVPKVNQERKTDTGLYLLIIMGPSALVLFIAVLVACIYSKKSVRKTSSKKKAVPAKAHTSLNLNQMAQKQEKDKVENIYSNFSA